MRSRVLLIASAIACGCAGSDRHETTSHALLVLRHDGDAVHGADLGASIGYRGVEAGLRVEAQRLSRALDPSRHTGGGLGAALRVSLFGLLSDGDHRLEHWFDLGGHTGAAAGLASLGGIADYRHAWLGGWLEIGLGRGTSYPVLVVELQREVFGAPWQDHTVLGVGLGFARRARGASGLGDWLLTRADGAARADRSQARSRSR